MKPYRSSSVLGIDLEGGRVNAVVLARSGGGRLQIRRVAQARLSLDPLTSPPELVGREIRDCLDKAGVREKRCVVCVPLKWALTLQAGVPDMPEADVAGYLAVQAERGFPFAPEDLALAISRCRMAQGAAGQGAAGQSAGHATIVAIPHSHLAALQQALRAARLHPVSMTLGMAALVEGARRRGEPAAEILAREGAVDMAVTAGEGIVALRTLEEAAEPDQIGARFDADSIARQLRITLGQVPGDLRGAIHKVRVYGYGDLAAPILAELRPAIERLGMSVEAGKLSELGPLGGVVAPEGKLAEGKLAEGELSEGAPPDALKRVSPPAIAAAANLLMTQFSSLEFLPPRVSRFTLLPERIFSRRMGRLAVAAAAALVIAAGVFSAQSWRLSNLENDWKAIEPRVKQMDALQEQIRKVRPWFEDAPADLVIARKIAEAFPEEGSVWVKTLEIKEASDVSCSGNATSNREWLRTLDRLRATKGITELQVMQIRGDNPMQFTLSFRWNGGASDGQ